MWLPAAILMAPHSLGDGLRAIGALDGAGQQIVYGSDAVDHSLDAPPPPDRTGAKWLIGAGGATFVAGIAGTLLSPGCETRDRSGRCVAARGSDDAYPIMVVVGLAAAITGGYWWRLEVPPPD